MISNLRDILTLNPTSENTSDQDNKLNYKDSSAIDTFVNNQKSELLNKITFARKYHIVAQQKDSLLCDLIEDPVKLLEKLLSTK